MQVNLACAGVSPCVDLKEIKLRMHWATSIVMEGGDKKAMLSIGTLRKVLHIKN